VRPRERGRRRPRGVLWLGGARPPLSRADDVEPASPRVPATGGGVMGALGAAAPGSGRRRRDELALASQATCSVRQYFEPATAMALALPVLARCSSPRVTRAGRLLVPFAVSIGARRDSAAP